MLFSKDCMIFILCLIDLLKENPLKILTEAKFCYNGNAPWVSQVWGLIRGFIRLPGTPQPTSFCSFTSTSVWLQMWNVPLDRELSSGGKVICQSRTCDLSNPLLPCTCPTPHLWAGFWVSIALESYHSKWLWWCHPSPIHSVLWSNEECWRQFLAKPKVAGKVTAWPPSSKAWVWYPMCLGKRERVSGTEDPIISPLMKFL